ncbi:threonine aldolase family protein [Chitinilyticum piscinae]|uniref:L-threonine aldolase n=1 Tax=Chitinilyticum piscinae TaxID=2866724 RepID=A0A8J7FPW2_9NEIS|nr:low specificity L-threonine aldolase [Chitinilyticum piscinae]MBE9608436.1 low specificity L-threonine aldolase [Chitinilyticum piscinae]
MRYDFASDNTAGICPEALEALLAADRGCQASYGMDDWTAQASDAIRQAFACPQAEVFFVFNGTAANSLALASLCQSYHSVICHEQAHVETDECGGPEFFSNGTKLLLGRGANGKLDANEIDRLVARRSDIHYPKPKVVTLTQSTESGTVYTPAELREVCAHAKRLGLHTHMDGARFANALASLGCSPAELSWRAGIEVMSLGGTKQGMPVGEAIVFFEPTLAEDFAYRCKQAGQLASKMRYLSAPWVGMLQEGVWLRHAAHANAMATRLAEGLRQIPGIELLFPVEANAVFARIDGRVQERLKARGWVFYGFINESGARFVSSWATQPDDVDALLQALREAIIETMAAPSVR